MLDVRDLRVVTEDGVHEIVGEVGFHLERGAALGIVGESGSGKTTVAMALLGFARAGTRIAGGSVAVDGTELIGMSPRQLVAARGHLVSYVPQNPAGALSPGMRIRRQLDEVLGLERTALRSSERADRVREAFQAAQLPVDAAFMDRYPHQLSGGQQQRVAIAMALVGRPPLVVLDEPTTGLDVVTQDRLLDVIAQLRAGQTTTMVYVSHDLGVLRSVVDRVAVMYGGRIVEEAPVDQAFVEPRHPYTRRLLEAVPRMHPAAPAPRGLPGKAVEPRDRPDGCPFGPRCEVRERRCDTMPDPEVNGRGMVRCWARTRPLSPRPGLRGIVMGVAAPVAERVLVVEDLHATYERRATLLARARPAGSEAVAGVSFSLQPGACIGLLGESGSGKSTLARCLAGLHEPRAGRILLDGLPLAGLAAARRPEERRRLQLVFQDPESSLNPRADVASLLARPLDLFFGLGRAARSARVAELLEQVHLPAGAARRWPRELSGGEKQRVALARALAARPDVLICDEVTSALDVAVQASVLDLLRELQRELGTALVFISHDLAVVRAISASVVLMQEGVVQEAGATQDVFAAPTAEYTRTLLAAVRDIRPGDHPAFTGDVALATGDASTSEKATGP